MIRPLLNRLAPIGLALLIAAPAAKADFNLLITENGGATLVIADGGLADIDGIVNGSITADTLILNGFLTSFQFTTLGATSNRLDSPLSPGSAAQVTQLGLVSRLLGTPGVSVLSVIATDTDFSFAGTGVGQLTTVASDSFLNTAAGDSRTLQSFFDPTDTDLSSPPPVGTPSSLLAFPFGGTGSSSSMVANPVGPVTGTFALTAETILVLGPATSASNIPSDLFTGGTQLRLNAVPEPTSMALLGVGLLGVLRVARRRKSS